MEGFRDPIFKGCTRPAMFVGVPLLPCLLVSGLFLLAAVWTFYIVSPYLALFLFVAYIPIFIAMREITKKDDQRLRQMLMHARMRFRQRAVHQLAGAVSYSPIRYKRRKPQ
jgi:type IV secretion system protein VirB3